MKISLRREVGSSRNLCVSFLRDESPCSRSNCKIVYTDSSGWLFLGVAKVCKVRYFVRW